MRTEHRAITPRPASARIQQLQKRPLLPSINSQAKAPMNAPTTAIPQASSTSRLLNINAPISSGIAPISSGMGGMVAIAPSPRMFSNPFSPAPPAVSRTSASVLATPSAGLSRGIGSLALSSPAGAKTASNGAGGLATAAVGVEKGLRQFSAMVCAKVEEKGMTTYNEVTCSH